jgi:hypothetical protein
VCAAEVAHREERRISMGLGIAEFPFVRMLDGFEFDAQPSPGQVVVAGTTDQAIVVGSSDKRDVDALAHACPIGTALLTLNKSHDLPL